MSNTKCGLHTNLPEGFGPSHVGNAIQLLLAQITSDARGTKFGEVDPMTLRFWIERKQITPTEGYFAVEVEFERVG